MKRVRRRTGAYSAVQERREFFDNRISNQSVSPGSPQTYATKSRPLRSAQSLRSFTLSARQWLVLQTHEIVRLIPHLCGRGLSDVFRTANGFRRRVLAEEAQLHGPDGQACDTKQHRTSGFHGNGFRRQIHFQDPPFGIHVQKVFVRCQHRALGIEDSKLIVDTPLRQMRIQLYH